VDILAVREIKKYFFAGTGLWGRPARAIKAVDGVSLTVRRGQTAGLVGESGCGKSTLGRTILRLFAPTAGRVLLGGEDITDYPPARLRPLRRKMQMIFQDPLAALNPRLTALAAVETPLRSYGQGKEERRRLAREMLRVVGLNASCEGKYPHEMSGGQRQRVVVARAMVLEPQFVVCDEPVSALDVSVRAQVLNLLRDMGERLGLSYLFISHDLSVVYYFCDWVYVMYLGKIVEEAAREEIFAHPAHPYTEALLSAVLLPDPGQKRVRIILQGDLPDPLNPPAGCRFYSRCPYAVPRCEEEPPLRELRPGHRAACWLH
jgi:oligopeptide/dipeptide ABC transporter ATP-binding protein